MILVGLQNAEKGYEKTRHNAGAIVLKYMVEKAGATFKLDKYTNSFKSDTGVYLPNTYMNLSGESVVKIVKNENIKSSELVVFVDDVTQPVGKYKISIGEGASSHNGIKSIIENLGGKNDFIRVRIGVGKVLPDGKLYEPGPDRMSDFVLSNLNGVEIAQMQSLSEAIMGELLNS